MGGRGIRAVRHRGGVRRPEGGAIGRTGAAARRVRCRARRPSSPSPIGTLLFVAVAVGVFAAAYFALVARRLVRPTRPARRARPVTTTTAPKPAGPYKVTTGVNMRQGPGTTFPSVGTIETGRAVLVVCVIEGEPVDGPNGTNSQVAAPHRVRAERLRLVGVRRRRRRPERQRARSPPVRRPDRQTAPSPQARWGSVTRDGRSAVVVHGRRRWRTMSTAVAAGSPVPRFARVDRVRSARDLDAEPVAGGEPVTDGPAARTRATNTPSASRVDRSRARTAAARRTRCTTRRRGARRSTRTKKSTWSSVDVDVQLRRHRSDELERLAERVAGEHEHVGTRLEARGCRPRRR